MSFLTILSAIGKWFKKAVVTVEDKLIPLAITLTEAVKTAEGDGLLPAVAETVDAATGTVIATDVNATIIADLPTVLADELTVPALIANPTPAEAQAFATTITTAIAGKAPSAQSQFYSTFAVQVYDLIYNAVHGNPSPLTFAQKIALIEAGYQDYLADKAAETAL